MPSSYTKETIPLFECSKKMTTLTYYILVLYSLTGLSTLLRLTDFRMAQEFPVDNSKEAEPPLTSKYNSLLRVEPEVLEHCKRKSNAQTIFLKRRFEYNFKLLGFEVVMLHFLCDQNKLHLVEVYHINNRILRDFVAPVVMKAVGTILRFVKGKRTKKD